MQPAIVGLCEVQNGSVVEDIISATSWNLTSVIPPSEDVQGYDVALLIDPTRITVVDAQSFNVNHRFMTRDVLHARLVTNQHSFDVVANHWPSRTIAEGEALRISLAYHCSLLLKRILKFSDDELRTTNGGFQVPAASRLDDRWNHPCFIFGDFNDCPYDRSIVEMLRSTQSTSKVIAATRLKGGTGRKRAAQYAARDTSLYNPMWGLLSGTPGGTAYYRSAMYMLDQLLVSSGTLRDKSKVRLDQNSLHIPTVAGDDSLTTRSGRPRAFNNKTRKGWSDHLPIVWNIDVDD